MVFVDGDARGDLADEEVVERECLLFEAGEYADRGVTITEDDLREIAANTAGEIPVRIEHMRETPFDGALGVVTRVRAAGRQLWGTLRQPAEAWSFVQRAGARALSVAVDIADKRLVETSFVCRPRVAGARVFSEDRVVFEVEGVVPSPRPADTPLPKRQGEGPERNVWCVDCGVQDSLGQSSQLLGEKEERRLSSVRQFAEGLIAHLRGVIGSGEEAVEGGQDSERAAETLQPIEQFAEERAALERGRSDLQARQVEQQVADLKRQGLLRGTEKAEALAKAILQFCVTNVVQFGEEEVPAWRLFMQLLEENGPVVPMGEMARADLSAGSGAADRLIAMAKETARKENVGYLAAFGQVGREYPELARAARDEAYAG